MLPLTRELIDRNRQLLSAGDVAILHVNHDLDDVHHLTGLLSGAGADVTFVAVEYSDDGYNSHDIRARIETWLADSGGERMIVVEDGGHYVTAPSSLVSLSVEQTTNGHRRANDAHAADGLPHPVMSISRSTLKTRIEPIILGVRIVDELSSLLAMAGRQLLGMDVVVLGYGILGRSLAWRLRGAYACRVSCVDVDPIAVNSATADGFTAQSPGEPEAIGRVRGADLVLGATGVDQHGGLLRSASVGLTHPLYLASASSGDLEFQSIIRDQSFLESCTRRRWGLDGGPELRLNVLANGLPVNFFRPDSQSLSAEFADLLNFRLVEAMFYGMVQGSSHLAPQVHHWADAGRGPWLADEEMLSEWKRVHKRSAIDWLEMLAPHPSEAMATAARHPDPTPGHATSL